MNEEELKRNKQLTEYTGGAGWGGGWGGGGWVGGCVCVSGWWWWGVEGSVSAQVCGGVQGLPAMGMTPAQEGGGQAGALRQGAAIQLARARGSACTGCALGAPQLI